MFHGGLEHLKIETRLIKERFTSVMGQCDRDVKYVLSIFKVNFSVSNLARMFPILDLSSEENEVQR